jgi:hypothetical protein
MRCARELLAIALACAACSDDGGAIAMTSVSSDGSSEGTEGSSGDAATTESTGGTESGSSSSADESTTGVEVPSAVPGRDCPPDSFLDATNFGVPFFTTWCTGCHSSDLVGDAERQMAPSEYNFDSIDVIRTNLLHAYSTAADDHDDMPPAGGPSPEDRERLGEWLACGAP